MKDSKSKFPDFQEMSSMAGKLFTDIKNSICNIMKDFKHKHTNEPKKTATKHTASRSVQPKAATAAKSTVAKTSVSKTTKKPATSKPRVSKTKKDSAV